MAARAVREVVPTALYVLINVREALRAALLRATPPALYTDPNTVIKSPPPWK